MVKRNLLIRSLITAFLIIFAFVVLVTNGFGYSAKFVVELNIFKEGISIISWPSLLISLVIIVALFFTYFIYVKKHKDDEDKANCEKKAHVIENISDYVSCFILAVLTVYFFFVFIAFPVTVEQTSMMPNLEPGTKLIIKTGHNNIEREDIVVFSVDSEKLNIYGRDDELWIKRVIGLPGDKISFNDGYLYVNDVLYHEDYLFDGTSFKKGSGYDTQMDLTRKSCKTLEDVLALTGLSGDTIPEGYYLLLGDNRSVSLDSWSIGLVPKDLILGRAVYIQKSIISFEKIK